MKMAEVVIPIPEELEEELKQVSGTEWSLVVNRLVRSELAKLLEVKSIVSKSQLTRADVKELSEKVDRGVRKVYEVIDSFDIAIRTFIQYL